MKYLPIALLLSLHCLPALCGGDSFKGKVESYRSEGKTTYITFTPTQDTRSFYPECKTLQVELRHENLTWYSFIPFLGGSHPSHREHKKGLALLKKAQEEHKSIALGYMGFGLKPSGKPCHFKSRGLRPLDQHTVISYHDRV